MDFLSDMTKLALRVYINKNARWIEIELEIMSLEESGDSCGTWMMVLLAFLVGLRVYNLKFGSSEISF